MTVTITPAMAVPVDQAAGVVDLNLAGVCGGASSVGSAGDGSLAGACPACGG